MNSRSWLFLCLCLSLAASCSAPQPEPSAEQQKGAEPLFEEITLFQKGEKDYFCYRIPALVTSTKGTLLAFAEARNTICRDDAEIELVMKRSLDNGKTWGELQIVVDDGIHTVGNPCPVVDQTTGTIWLPFARNNQRILVTKSTDDGVSWSEPVDISESVKDPAWKYLGTGPGHGIQLTSGRLLIPSWGDTSPGPATWKPDKPNWGKVQFSYTLFSDDHGATWQRGETLTNDMSDECEAIETVDGSIYMNMRSRQKKHRRAYAWSQDGGNTWSDVEFDETLPEPSCQAGLVRFTHQDQYQKNRVLLTHPSNTEERTHMMARVSYDEGKTWPVSKLLYDGSAAYSDLAIAPDMTIVCLYEVDRYAKIVLARFNIEWLTEGSDSLQKK